jgi:8-oxo-dGTP pyrophosphatase MutT (NUDIX family)
VTTGARAVRPVDAAGLVLIRQGAAEPEVLLGRRHRRAGFLPDIYVFPGGRVDRDDALPSGFAEPLHPAVLDQLRRASSGRPAAAFARAAIRETFEETGLLLAQPDGRHGAAGTGAVWQAFATHGAAPAFAAMDFVCRAITPAASRRRYNTRFFLADGAHATGTLAGDGELDDLRWWPLAALPELEIVDVTQFVLAEALRRWRQRLPVGREPGRLFCYRSDTARWRIGAAGPWQSVPEPPSPPT